MNTLITVDQVCELHYAVRISDDAAFRLLLNKLGATVQIYDKSKGERMIIDQILGDRLWNSQVYACRPPRMIDAI